jgi:hypothetical protein
MAVRRCYDQEVSPAGGGFEVSWDGNVEIVSSAELTGVCVFRHTVNAVILLRKAPARCVIIKNRLTRLFIGLF